MTLFRRLSRAAVVATLVQIGSGGLVRATHSGDGCPDWPRCFGRWVPPLEYHALIEYTHRFIALIAMSFVIAVAVVGVLRHRREPRIAWPAAGAAVMIVGLAGIGAAVVNSGLNEGFVTLHIAIAMALVAFVVYIAVTASLIERAGASAAVDRPTRRLALASAVSVFGVILLGADVRASGAALAFGDWPLMDGRLIPAFESGLDVRHFMHRAGVAVAGALILALVVRAWKARASNGAAAALSVTAGVLFVVQSLVGAAQIWTTLAAPAVAMHVWLSSLVWAALVATVTLTRGAPEGAAARAPRAPRAEPAPISGGATPLIEAVAAPASLGERVRAYVALTKPRIIVLLLITTVPTMALAAGGWPSLGLVAATLAGGTLAAGAANAINMYLDRDIDAIMGRTRRRPLPSHTIEPASALVFAISLAAASFVLMTTRVNLLSAVLAQAAIVFYVFVYTVVLKRSTPQNIVIGGAAGAVPALVGWAAVTGEVSLESYILFAVVFFWTPPHFWALAMRFARDYEAAGVPMLPVVAGEEATRRQILLYSVVTVLVSLALVPVAPMGWAYLSAAAVLGAAFVLRAVRLLREATPDAAWSMFKFSIVYLAALFAAVGVDALMFA